MNAHYLLPVAAKKKKLVPFSTTLGDDTKRLLERFCKRRGLRQNHFVAQAILEKLEDEMDAEVIGNREFEDLVPWEKTGS